MEPKTSWQLERHLKGLANHWRLDILFAVARQDKLTLEELITKLNGQQRTISVHTLKLEHAGLLRKKYVGRNVVHSLSPYGRRFVRFLKTL